MTRRSIWRGDWRSLAWPVLAYAVRPLALYVRDLRRLLRPQDDTTPSTEPEIVA